MPAPWAPSVPPQLCPGSWAWAVWYGEQPWTSCWKASSSQSPGQHCPDGDQLSAARERTLPEQGPCGGHVLFGLSVTWTGRILGAEPVWPEPPLRATPPPRGGHPAPLTRPRGPRPPEGCSCHLLTTEPSACPPGIHTPWSSSGPCSRVPGDSLPTSTAHGLDLRTRPPARAAALPTFPRSPHNCLRFTDVETEAQGGSVSPQGHAAGTWQGGGLDGPPLLSFLLQVPGRLPRPVWTGGKLTGSARGRPGSGAFPSPRTSCLILLVWVSCLSCQFSSFLLEKVTAHQGTG